MFYVDSQRTVTRRDSSVIINKRHGQDVDYDTWSSTQGHLSNAALTNDYVASIAARPKGSVRKELITMMFESMLDCIIESWETIHPHKADGSFRYTSLDFGKTPSDTILGKKKKTAPITRRPSKSSKRSRSRVDEQTDLCQTIWWSSPDEKAIIRFRNGNMYEGNISAKCMHGEGRFQWADGTVYLGHFQNNEMAGKGTIQWKNDSWYEGEFAGNLRHGKGLYVDSRSQRSYTGGWHCGTKHGEGVIYYSKDFKNSYDGQWIYVSITTTCMEKKMRITHVPMDILQSQQDLFAQEIFNALHSAAPRFKHPAAILLRPSILVRRLIEANSKINKAMYLEYPSKPSDCVRACNAIRNERYGYGSREYCALSGYKGDWNRNEREGKGLMIWPNHDFYRGGWQNGVMSGYGIYIWEACYNNTMALPSINAFRGMWEKGQRNGYGILNLGLGLGSHYKGEFKNNKKHGVGKFITNNGLIIQGRNLFTDDNLGPLISTSNATRYSQDTKRTVTDEPYQFEICDSTVGLIYHIDQAFKNIDRKADIRKIMINDYLENNKDFAQTTGKVDHSIEGANRLVNIEDLFMFEENSLRQTLKCYKIDLLNIYYKYATICNTEEIAFTPVLIRLFLWQLYYDCNVHERGLTLIEIDKIYHQNPEWLARSPHNPFEKVYFWQFLHSLISVASKLYAKRELPDTKPDTILASAFRNFMDRDVLRGTSRQRGHLVNGYGKCIPLRATYELYRSLGEPHTVRTFLCAVRRPPHCVERPQPGLVDVPDICLPLGRNVYIFGDELTFVVDDNDLPETFEINADIGNLKLFNLGNLSSKTIIKIFSRIFPNLCEGDKIMNLDIELSFLEFFEAFVTCAIESIRVRDEEFKWRNKFPMNNDMLVPPSTPAGHGTRSK